MRPKLEYSSTTWNPQQVTQKRQIEQVQRNAARFVSNKPFNYQNPTSITSMIQQLNWPTLEARRRSSDLVLMYKVVHNLVAVPITYHPPRSPRYMECVRLSCECVTTFIFPTNCYIVESVTRIYNKPGEFGQLQVSCSTTNNYVNWQ